MKRGALALPAAFAALVAFGTGAAGACTAVPGGRVVLESDAVDPEVFLWDSRVRLIDYAAGSWGSTREVVAHTMLAEPGTQALVVTCIPAAAHPKFASGDADAIGVKVVTGPYRGRYGWVLSSDLRQPRPMGESATISDPRN
jgi:hypothetical protein